MTKEQNEFIDNDLKFVFKSLDRVFKEFYSGKWSTSFISHLDETRNEKIKYFERTFGLVIYSVNPPKKTYKENSIILSREISIKVKLVFADYKLKKIK